MSIEGRIAVDVGFSDSTAATGVQSLKRVALTSTDSYSSGKVAIVSGTAGTAAVFVAINPTLYINSAGAAVSFTASVERIAFASSRQMQCADSADVTVESSDNQVAVSICNGDDAFTITPQYTAGTASYTLVMYGP